MPNTFRQAVLDHLLDADEWVSRQQLIRLTGFDKGYAALLGAADSEVQGTLKSQGLVEVQKVAGRVLYRLTDAGRRQLGKASSGSPNAGATRLGATSDLGAVILRIKWTESVEWLQIDLAGLREGTRIQTTEQADDGSRASYSAECIDVTRPADSPLPVTFVLEYRREEHPHLHAGGWLFGGSEIEIRASERGGLTAAAKWRAERAEDDAEQGGEADTCEILSDGILDDVTREWVERIARKQQQRFRERLFEHSVECALTGERTRDVLEAAHIVPARLGGKAAAANGLLLRADVHRLFDRSLIVIDGEGCITVAKSLKGSTYADIRTVLPADVFARVRLALQKAKEAL